MTVKTEREVTSGGYDFCPVYIWYIYKQGIQVTQHMVTNA